MNIREHENDSKIRAGIIIRLRGTNKILIEHATGKKAPMPCMDIPKGHVTTDEPIMVGAVREIKEETGLNLNLDELIPMGVFNYNKSVLHIFYIETDFDIDSCHCDSMFTDSYGRSLPEVDGYALFDIVSDNLDTSLLYNGLKPILKQVFEKIKQLN